jgi:anti-anti-sigma factor
MLRVTVENRGDFVILHCVGRIVHGDEAAVLCPAVRQETRNVVLDLTQVDTIDAAGIGALVSLQAAGIYLKLMNPTKQVREILRITKLDSLFEIGESQLTPDTAGPTPASMPNNHSEKLQVPVA